MLLLLFLVILIALIWMAIKYSVLIILYFGAAVLLLAIFRRLYEFITNYKIKPNG